MKQAALDIGFAHDRTTGKEDWLTPPEIVTALGPFDLDPCSPIGRPWDTASNHYTLHDNGLLKPWVGRVWLNPPLWQRNRALDEAVFARTETKTFFPWVWKYATALLWLKGRLSFYTREGNKGGVAGAPSVLIAYGALNAARLKDCTLAGHFTWNRG